MKKLICIVIVLFLCTSCVIGKRKYEKVYGKHDREIEKIQNRMGNNNIKLK